jgi:hypothetical protein
MNQTIQLDKEHISVSHLWINDVLKLRVARQGIKIEDLFLVVYSPKGAEGEIELDTVYGKLKTFFTNSIPSNKIFLLHKSKYSYPQINVKMENLPGAIN